jgi:hypothetical protein
MEAAYDFSFIYDVVKDVYSEVGRPSKEHQKVVTRHFWQGFVEEVYHLRHQKK